MKKVGKGGYSLKRLTVGHPVSAIYILGSFGILLATSTDLFAKFSVVQAAAPVALTFANHGYALAI